MNGLIWSVIAMISYRFLSDAINAETLISNWKRNEVSKRITDFGMFVYS
jgi:hypothetical protein